ncbi:MAG: cupin domain-containing protein [Bryobacteraceae bacterium]
MLPTNRLALALLLASPLFAADPTFLRRRLSDVQPQPDDLTANARGASYKPLFGIGDPQASQLKSVARYGELTLEPGGASATVSYPAEEQIYFILDGRGRVTYAGQPSEVRRHDYMYLAPGIAHGVENAGSEPLRLLVMGFRIPAGTKVEAGKQLMLANTDEVAPQQLASHGPSVQFDLLMGTTESKRDRLAAASQMVSLFIMDFAPGGTNIPHHHEMAEEIYYILKGHGDMVAGGGADGNEGRYPARQGDAFFIRLNATVGFYSGSGAGNEHDQVLAVRSRFPFAKGE